MARDWVPIAGLTVVGLLGAALVFGLMAQPEMAPPASHSPVVSTQGAADESTQTVFKTPVGDRPAAPDGALSVVWLVSCSVRQDLLAPYGGPPSLTPSWSRMAESGVRFSDPIAAAPWSRPSVAGMLTGRHALELGFVDAGTGPSQGLLSEDAVTLPEFLAERGWTTLVANASPALRHDLSGVWQGVDHLWDAHPKGWKAEHRVDHADVMDRALRMLEDRAQDRPFFLQIVLADSHKPVKVRPAEYESYEAVAPGMAPYAATVRRTDDALGRLREQLGRMGLADQTLVVAVTDHGEGLSRPAHHGPAHGRFLAPTVAKVAWLMEGPGLAEGALVDGVVSGVDLAPTIAGVLGLSDFPSTEGLDLSRLVREGGRSPREVAYIDTWYHNANRAAVYAESGACQWDFGSINLQDSFEAGCFNRLDDPEHATLVENERLSVSLQAWRAGHLDDSP